MIRRSTAAGLTGLTIALLVGVMSFAFTTRPAGQPQESVARYLAVPGRVVDLGQVSVERTAEAVAVLVPGGADARSVLDEARVTSFVPAPIADTALSGALAAARVPGGDTMPSAVAVAAAPPPAEVAAPEVTANLAPGDRVTATVSFYYCELGPKGRHPGDGGDFCGVMRDGTVVYDGAAACAYEYLGQQFRIEGDPTGRVYRCADTGSAVHGHHRDIWFMSSDEGWEWQLEVGQVATIEILP